MRNINAAASIATLPHSGGHPGQLILFGPLCRAVIQQKVNLSPRESPRTITTSCQWVLLWLWCTLLPGQHMGSDWHINSPSTSISSCSLQNECHITTSQRLIINGLSAGGILPTEALEVTSCKAGSTRTTLPEDWMGIKPYMLTAPLPSPLLLF